MSAKNNHDYVGGEGTLAFSHGETQKVLEITILESDVRKITFCGRFIVWLVFIV